MPRKMSCHQPQQGGSPPDTAVTLFRLHANTLEGKAGLHEEAPEFFKLLENDGV